MTGAGATFLGLMLSTSFVTIVDSEDPDVDCFTLDVETEEEGVEIAFADITSVTESVLAA